MSQFLKNTAGQHVQFQVVDTSGDPVAGGVVVDVSKDGGSLTGSAGALTHLANGYWDYVPTQAETDADHMGLRVSASGAVPFAINILTATKLPSDISTELAAVAAKIDTVDANVDAVLADTADIQPKIGTPTTNLAADIATVQADLDNPSQYKADVSGLATTAALTTVEGKIDAVDSNVDAILDDTDTMEADLKAYGDSNWASGGASSSEVVTAIKNDPTIGAHFTTCDTIDTKVDTLDANVDAILADTADMQPKLGTPADTDLATDIANVVTHGDANWTSGEGGPYEHIQVPKARTVQLGTRHDGVIIAYPSVTLVPGEIATIAVDASKLLGDGTLDAIANATTSDTDAVSVSKSRVDHERALIQLAVASDAADGTEVEVSADLTPVVGELIKAKAMVKIEDTS